MTSVVRFVKMNGLGNSIIVADFRGRCGVLVTLRAVHALMSHAATRFDQIMMIHDPRSAGTDGYIEILNRDSSRALACGNGTRCVAQVLAAEMRRSSFSLETEAGLLTAEVHENGLISVNMGFPLFGWRDIPLAEKIADTRKVELLSSFLKEKVFHAFSAVSIGNPHAVFWASHSVGSYDLGQFGPLLEKHPMFPERVNITIAHVTSRSSLTIRTWERGAGLTKACGSAACAAAVLAARTNRTGRHVRVTLPGGDLEIFWREDDAIIMTGPTEREFSGYFDPATGNWQRDGEGVA